MEKSQQNLEGCDEKIGEDIEEVLRIANGYPEQVQWEEDSNAGSVPIECNDELEIQWSQNSSPKKSKKSKK